MAKFKIGDKVISKDRYSWTEGLTGTIIPNYKGEEHVSLLLVNFAKKDADDQGHDAFGRKGSNWYINASDLRKAADDTFTVGSHADFATDINVKGQQRVILKHLKDGKNITQMKAMGVYHVARLSDVIMKLRRKGYDIRTELCDDEVGGTYASYFLHADI